MTNSIEVVLSSRRREIYVYKGDRMLFSITDPELSDIPDNILEDSKALDTYVKSEYRDMISDMV